MHRRKRGRDNDLPVGDVLDEEAQLLHEHDRFLDGLVHLPIACDKWDSHTVTVRLKPDTYLSVKAATPGSVRPPRNSSEAPPPVEMCVTRSAIPAFLMAAIESPPPMIVVPLTFATARATALVPAAKASISKTP